MNELKIYLQKAMLYQFWILSGLVLLMTGIVFYLTNASLSDLITTRTSAIEGQLGKLKTIQGTVDTHPNSFSHSQMTSVINGLEVDVQKAWKFQYDRQKDLLVWPREAFSKDSSLQIIDGWRPFEKFADEAAKDERITITDRAVYRGYIGPVFKNISRIIGTEWKAKLGVATSGGYPGGGGASTGAGSFSPPTSSTTSGSDPYSNDLVRWSETSQQTLLNEIIPWYNDTSDSNPPTVGQIYYTQEDIWLLTGLLNIIRETNKEANENFQAIVKEIEFIRMGYHASRDAGKLFAGDAISGGLTGPPGNYGGGGSGMMGSAPPSNYSQGGRGDVASQLTSQRKAAFDPADGRYVSPQFAPIKGKDLRAAVKSVQASNAMSAVAKRVPVRMRLKVDLARLNELIAACGSGRMMLEVVQVRLNTDPAEAITAGGGGGAAGGSGSGGSRPSFGNSSGGTGNSSMMSEGSGYPGSGGSAAAAASAAEKLTETPVEIFGLIYLYNPPNIGTLGSNKVTAKPLDLSGTPPPSDEPKPAAPPEASTTPASNGAAGGPATNPTTTGSLPPTDPPPNTPPTTTRPPTSTPPQEGGD